MEFSPPRTFISYSRSDGREFAERFEERIVAEGLTAWRDMKSVEGGENVLQQVLRAIEEAEHFVLILTPRALASDWTKREWTHARKKGRKISPILGVSGLRKRDLPSWMQRVDVYDIGEPERWARLIAVLKGPGETLRVPYMKGHLPAGFVPRPEEYREVKEAVLAERHGGAGGLTVALTTALVGAGGYGKTTLANGLCRDEDVQAEFTDGIIQVEIGKERDDVRGLIVDVIEKLDPKGRRPGFEDTKVAGEQLAEIIGERRLLLVIDDVWRESQLRPFLLGGPNCVRLVTTRKTGVLPQGAQQVDVDEMRAAEATALIGGGLPVEHDPVARRRLAALARRLEGWAQMLEIANSWMRKRVRDGEPVLAAIGTFKKRLHKHGLTHFDPKEEVERNKAIRVCLEASLEDLGEDEVARLGELAILPEDEDVPLEVVEALWEETAGLDEDEADEVYHRLKSLSLLQRLDLSARTLRFHDNLTWYLRDRIGEEGQRAAHTAMAHALEQRAGGDWAALPAGDVYGWRFGIRHLRGAGRDEDADRLLLDYAWIGAKLAARGAQELLESYLPLPRDEAAGRVGRAITLSAPALARDPRQLARQLFGRLGKDEDRPIVALVEAARQDPDFRPAPRWPGLTPPGIELLRIRHDGYVRSAAFAPDGARIVTASDDRTARIWDAASGGEIAVLRGHDDPVTSAAFAPDGARIVTASWDNTARIWDAASGDEIAILRGHDHHVTSAAFARDCARIVTASWDSTARIWDAASGDEIAVLRGHDDAVQSAAFAPDGARIVTASDDRTACIWDAASGDEIAVLRGHDNAVTSAAFARDGARIVTASWDTTARIWDAASGDEIAILRGHDHHVTSAAFARDGARIVTASSDTTARIWDAASGDEIAVLRGHDDPVTSAAFARDGARIVTASWDTTARIWDAAAGDEIAVLRGHDDPVTSAAFAPDGARIVTASWDNTARIWDAASGDEIAILRGHDHHVTSASFARDGARIVTASWDTTARIWDAASGDEIAILRGHDLYVTSAAFAPDGARIVTASDDRTARIWDAASGDEIAVLRGHDSAVRSAAFAPDGARIVTASWDSTARIWDAASGDEIAVLRGHDDAVQSAAFAPDGARIVTASDDRTACIWDAASGDEIAVLRGHDSAVTSAAFARDGARIVTASWDTTARIWDAASGDEIAILRGHDNAVISAAFARDGARIVTASSDTTACIWDAASGDEIAAVAFDAALSALAVHGTAIALGDRLGRVHVVDLDVEEPGSA